MSSDDCRRAEWVRDQVEETLRRAGGAALLRDARIEAGWYLAQFFLWSGSGQEPVERLSARVEILSTRLERADG